MEKRKGEIPGRTPPDMWMIGESLVMITEWDDDKGKGKEKNKGSRRRAAGKAH